MIDWKKRAFDYARSHDTGETYKAAFDGYLAGVRDALEEASKVARKEYEKPEGTAESIESAIRSLIPKD